ncbi:MAG: hypothetical protein RLP44_31520 [Aggregatilineales bacterium]
MAYVTAWLVPQRIIMTYSYGVTTAADVQENMHIMAPMVEEGIPFIHYITDGTDVTRNDLSLKDLKGIFGSMEKSPTMGWTCSINPNGMQRFLSAVIFQFAGMRGRSFASVDDSLKFLAEGDETLPSYEELAETYAAWRQSLVLEPEMS